MLSKVKYKAVMQQLIAAQVIIELAVNTTDEPAFGNVVHMIEMTKLSLVEAVPTTYDN